MDNSHTTNASATMMATERNQSLVYLHAARQDMVLSQPANGTTSSIALRMPTNLAN